jgi:RNA polymerase sigma-70 factor, ECF subfamily
MFGKAARLRREFEREALPHVNALYGTALRLTRNERDAEDLVQDTLLRAYRYWQRFVSGTNCKAWLYKILSNTFITRYHAQRRSAEVVAAAANLCDDAATDDILSHEVTHATRDPEGALASRLLSDDVVHALEALPADFRLAVLLCDVEEFSYKEIAEIMDVPIGTVMSRLHRGRRQLQKALWEFAGERGLHPAGDPAGG